MNKGISDIEKFEVVRKLSNEWSKDRYGIPIMRPVTIDMIDCDNIQAINFQNLKIHENNLYKFVLNFRYDKNLDSQFWTHPLKEIPKLQSAMGAGTPDFSVSSRMMRPELIHQVFKNRWCGCLWQECNILAIPTMVWDGKDTYDICFGNIPKRNVVLISTLGCMNHSDIFLAGYYEMMRRIEPSLIFVYGSMIDGMYGKFINFKYTEGFKTNYSQDIQLSLPLVTSRVFEKRRLA